MDAWMDICMYRCIHGYMMDEYIWMDICGWTHGWIHMDGYMWMDEHIWMDIWMDLWIDVWMNIWMDVWMDICGWTYMDGYIMDVWCG